MRLLVIHGPNLNLLGTREPEIYGTQTLDQLNETIARHAKSRNVSVAFYQSNHEGAIIDRIQEAAGGADGIIINAGALTHYSYAVYDALVAVGLPAIEVHLSDIHAREEWRRRSVIAPACRKQISGHGAKGYLMAVDALVGG